VSPAVPDESGVRQGLQNDVGQPDIYVDVGRNDHGRLDECIKVHQRRQVASLDIRDVE
jgi:hypothetical protein